MKFKVLNISALIVSIALLLHGVALFYNQGPPPPLKAGDMVKHKLHPWHGILIWKKNDGTACIRWHTDTNEYRSNLWDDTQLIEWEHE